MTYIHTTQSATTFDRFQEVDAAIGPDVPIGLIARYVGANDRGVAVTAVWASKADADRFAAERLFPALRQVFGGEPGAPVALVDFEAEGDLVIEATR